MTILSKLHKPNLLIKQEPERAYDIESQGCFLKSCHVNYQKTIGQIVNSRFASK